jgi:uncharacterized protein YecT (DUF1311 family)
MSGRATLLAIAFVFLVPAAATASFDCDKARTYVEKTVCADPLLGRLDEALARNYDAMLAADLGATRQSLRNEQFRWLATRNQCGSTQCLVDVYRARVDETCDYGVASGVHPDCMPSEDVLAGISRAHASEPCVRVRTTSGHACMTFTQAERQVARSYGVDLGTPYAKVKRELLRKGWKIEAGRESELICGSGYDAVCSTTFVQGDRRAYLTLRGSNSGMPLISIMDHE